MSLARAVTKRIKRTEAPPASPPLRSQSVKSAGVQIDRSKISAPVALVSTTNMLSYNAPDIATLKKKPSVISTHSADDSDNSISTRSRASSHASRDTLTDASSVGDSPTSSKPNHLSGYFAAANKSLRQAVSSGNLRQPKAKADQDAPAIPERALSHSKRAHERLAQKRSAQNLAQNSAQASQRTSADMFKPSPQEQSHPFGAELEQLDEVAEEFGDAMREAETNIDLAALHKHCLGSFCAADYLAEIQPLVDQRFGLFSYPAPLAWI